MTVTYSVIRVIPETNGHIDGTGIIVNGDGSFILRSGDQSLLANGGVVDLTFSPSGIGWRVLHPDLSPLSNGTAGSTGETANDVDGLLGASSRFVIAGTLAANNGDIMLHVRAADGSAVTDIAVDGSAAQDSHAMVAALADGGYAVVWDRNAGGTHQAWYAIYNADNSLRLAPTMLAAGATVTSAVTLDTGGFAVGYSDHVAVLDATGLVQHTAAVSSTNLVTLSNGYLLVVHGLGVTLIDPLTGDVLPGSPDAIPVQVDAGGYDVRAEWTAAGGSYDLAVEYSYFTDHDRLSGFTLIDVVRTSVGTLSDDVLAGDSLIDVMRGLAGHDALNGNAGNDVLDGGGGSDTMTGGTGDDTFVVNDAGDVVVEQVGEGIDTVQSSVSTVLGANVENLILLGPAPNAANINGVGNALDNQLIGTAGNNMLDGAGGDDFLIGGYGDDTLTGGTGVDTASYQYSGFGSGVTVDLSLAGPQSTGSGMDTLSGIENLIGSENYDNVLTGNAGSNSLIGGAGDDTLDGGGGADTLAGGFGDDTYVVDDAGDVIVADPFGNDTVRSSISYVLVGGLDNLILTGSANIDGTGRSVVGNDGNNVLTGTKLFGGAGNDTLHGTFGAVLDGGAGDDLLDAPNGIAAYGSALAGVTVSLALSGPQNTGGAGTDTLVGITGLSGSEFDDALSGTDGNDTLRGGAGDDTLQAGAGQDVLEGGAGDDTIGGGVGRDTASYASASAAVTVNLSLHVAQNTLGAGHDTLTQIEDLEGTSFDDVLTGNTGINTLYGGDGNDSLSGGAGNDTVSGGNGNDTASYASATAGVTVDLALVGTAQNTGAAGSDTLLSIESLQGSAFNDTLSGGTNNDTLEGGLGDDLLDGRSGFDAASYASAAAGVTVSLEIAGPQAIAGAGTDTFVSIEGLVGSAFADTLTGNASGNTLSGGSGDDVLDGRAGADLMTGGQGDDTYIVNNAGDIDIIQEAAGEGTDTVQASISFALVSNVEALVLTGSASINGTGNSAANQVTGNSGTNRLEGLAGDDRLDGGAGADTLIGGVGADQLIGGAGADWASYASSTLAVSVDLAAGAGLAGDAQGDTLTGIENLRGGSGNDILKGDAGANRLDGGLGNDVLDGGAGIDTADYALFGGALTVNLAKTIAQDTGAAGIDKLSGIENLVGGYANDTLIGSAVNNLIRGGDSNDLVNGGDGADILLGESGDDRLVGGAGNDRLTGDVGHDVLVGGSDTDTFVFASLSDSLVGSGRDFITDFVEGSDRIDLKGIETQVGQAFTYIGSAAFSNVAGQLRSYFASTQTIVEGDTNGDGAADFQIALKRTHTLSSTDFVL